MFVSIKIKKHRQPNSFFIDMYSNYFSYSKNCINFYNKRIEIVFEELKNEQLKNKYLKLKEIIIDKINIGLRQNKLNNYIRYLLKKELFSNNNLSIKKILSKLYLFVSKQELLFSRI